MRGGDSGRGGLLGRASAVSLRASARAGPGLDIATPIGSHRIVHSGGLKLGAIIGRDTHAARGVSNSFGARPRRLRIFCRGIVKVRDDSRGAQALLRREFIVTTRHREPSRLKSRNRCLRDRTHRRRAHRVAGMNARIGMPRQVHHVPYVHARLGERRGERATEGVKVDGRQAQHVHERIAHLPHAIEPGVRRNQVGLLSKRVTRHVRRARSFSLRSELRPRFLAVAMSQAPRLSGTPASGHFSKRTTSTPRTGGNPRRPSRRSSGQGITRRSVRRRASYRSANTPAGAPRPQG
jgi:hypothetical protein